MFPSSRTAKAYFSPQPSSRIFPLTLPPMFLHPVYLTSISETPSWSAEHPGVKTSGQRRINMIVLRTDRSFGGDYWHSNETFEDTQDLCKTFSEATVTGEKAFTRAGYKKLEGGTLICYEMCRSLKVAIAISTQILVLFNRGNVLQLSS